MLPNKKIKLYAQLLQILFLNSKINLSLQVIIKNHKYLNLTMSKTVYNRSPIIDFLILLYIYLYQLQQNPYLHNPHNF